MCSISEHTVVDRAAGWSQPLTQPAQPAESPLEEDQPQAALSSGPEAQQQHDTQQGADPAHLDQDSGSVPQADTEGDPIAAGDQQDSQVRQLKQGHHSRLDGSSTHCRMCMHACARQSVSSAAA
jgi:hypothetical protein